MRLKCLELHGFKSFADKTKIDFHSGVTGIVGPNGCGKSNVVDGVRWALGETSAKALRGGEMADVIFNGTDKRKPHSMAEVSLTFSDCESSLGVDFNEICITRRVYRDGKSEYEMNGNTCRLKDINKMFMDTGVGRSAYSIMEQGKIDMLLSAKPEDRRQVFEEAAGITKSKAEKKEALRKLEYTEANLLRVTDVLVEMKRQMGSMHRQATKARKYQELHEDVLILDSHLSYKRFHEMSAEKSELETSTASLRQRQAELENRIHDDEVQVAADRMELREVDMQLSNLRHQLNERQNQIQAADSRMGFNKERQRELENLIAQNSGDVASSEQRLLNQEEELKSADSALISIRENIASQKEQIEEHSRITAAAREERGRIERTLREARQSMHHSEGIIISSQAEIASHQGQESADRTRQEQLQRDVDNLHAERESKLQEEASTKAQLEDLKHEVESHELLLSQRERELQASEIELESTVKRLQASARLHSGRASRAQVLRQLLAEGEGLEKGTQAVLKGLTNPEFFKSGTRGLLSGFLEVEREFIPAVEASLGTSLHAVLVANTILAENIIDVLTQNQLGEAVILPEDLLRQTSETQMLTLPDGAVTWALDKVKVRDSVRPLVHQLLANVLIVPDLATAVRLKRDHPEVAFATLSGEFISSEGAMRGGVSKDKAGSILQRQVELNDLESEVVRLELELAALEAEQISRQDALRTNKVQLDEQREILQIRRAASNTLTGQLTLIARELQQFANKLEGLSWEQAELGKRQDALSRKMDEATARRARAQEELESRQEEASQLEAALDSAARNEADASELLGELRTALAVEQRAEQALNEQRAPMDSRLRELSEVIARRKREIESYHERIRAAIEENEHLQEEVAGGRSQLEELSMLGETRMDDRNALMESVTHREAGLSEIRREIARFSDQRGKEEVRVERIGLRMENLAAYALERYRIDLTTFEQDIHALLTAIQNQKFPRRRADRRALFEKEPVAGEMASGVAVPESPAEAVELIESETVIPDKTVLTSESEGLTESADSEAPSDAEEEAPAPAPIAEFAAAEEPTPDEPEICLDPEMAALLEEGPDWEFVESTVTELKQRLDAMGPVNLDAIQEYEELEERHNFLQNENDDLAKAKVELLAVIQRINTETKKRFADTFYQVRDNFRNTFKELFGNAGQADLILVNEEDPLESGIEVIAKPPGKKPTSITLLSGGERSMTAVALLFSIYMVKPSPFCILDELDAPLDESNIGRFLKMLDKFIEKSQFVIVTHNKRTMRRADVLYGVTMEEFGVSKPVGMKLSAEVERPRDQYVAPPEATAAEAAEATPESDGKGEAAAQRAAETEAAMDQPAEPEPAGV
ncbi:MAG: chromosome segregation protein [Verrucomicrobiales bacterium]|nr:chromosome segregation protein [Verrucomicrobiales bacterium]